MRQRRGLNLDDADSVEWAQHSREQLEQVQVEHARAAVREMSSPLLFELSPAFL